MADEQLERLKRKIPYSQEKYGSEENYEQNLLDLLEDARMIALGQLYPFLDDIDNVKLNAKEKNWVVRAAYEIYKWADNNGIKSYSETGLSWTRGNDGILSNEMLNELIPHASPPKRSEE